jgi:AraC-like DNA-binding protein
MKLDHVFDNLEIQTEPFALCEIHGVCDVALKPDAAVTLHYVLAGEGDIVLPNRQSIPISEGSLVLVPALVGHKVRNHGALAAPMPKCQPAELHLMHALKSTQGAEPSDNHLFALCAHLSIGLSGSANIVELVREPLVFHRSKGASLNASIEGLLRELSAPTIGSRAMIRALLLQAAIEMLRHRARVGDGALHWMAALRDPRVWQALKVMLDSPGERHSVESLAERTGMSRSSFAKRFTEAYGSGPMELLRELRMQKAGSLLNTTDLPVKRVAAMVGLSSRSAFSRQFEAKTGHSPRDFRKRSADD